MYSLWAGRQEQDRVPLVWWPMGYAAFVHWSEDSSVI